MKVVVSGGAVPERLAAYCRERDLAVDHLDAPLTAEELCARVADAGYYLLGGDEHLTRAVLEAAPSLRCVSFMGVGAGSFVDLDAARARGVRVLNTPGANGVAVAEFAVGMALGIMRGHFAGLRDPKGQPTRTSTELTGASVGILGLGSTGTALAGTLARGFSCRVRYHSRTRKPALEDALGLTYTGLPELFARSTTVFVCCSLTTETTGLVDRALLGTGPTPRHLVSTADPRVIDARALLAALERGALTAAALDGEYGEPLVRAQDGALAGSLVVTGHIAASSATAWTRMESAAVDNLIAAIGEDTA